MPKQDWLEILENASKPKKGTKIPRGLDFYSLMTAMSNAGMEVVPVSIPKTGEGMGLEPWNTGAGANGIVEPGKPVMLDKETNPPSVYHEGETVKPFPGGKNIIPAQTEEEQQGLSVMEKKEKLPGYATGGTVYDDPNSITPVTSTRPTNTLDLSPTATTYQGGQQQAFRTTQQRAAGVDPLMQNIANRSLQDYDARAGVSDVEAAQYAASNPNLTTGAKNAVAAKQKATYAAGLADLTGEISAESMKRAESANTELYNMGRTGVQDDLSRQIQEKTFGEQQYQSDVSRGQWEQSFGLEKQKYGDAEFGRMSDDAQTTSLETWLAKYPNATEADYDVAREYKTRQLQSADIANATASETYTQLKDSARWNEAENFLKAGDYANYAAVVKAVTGRDISTEQFKADREYLNNTRDIALDSARNELGDAVFNSIQNMINNGSSLAAVNQKLKEQGKRPINLPEYTSMRNASGLGQMEWDRQLQAFNTLIQSGDVANIKTAASQFSDMFPGVTFSADQLISDVGAERFATSMTDLSTLANSFDTWDEAAASVEGLSLIKNMGLTTDQAKDMFRAMKINAIDEEWKAISDSDWYKKLSTENPASAELISSTFAAGLTGELEFDIKPVYNVVGKDGFVQAFDNVVDANKFIGENADKGYTIEEKQNYIYKDMGTGDTVVVNNGTGESSVSGDSITETAQTLAARFAKAGSDYTEDDINAFKDANGRLPVDTKEMDTWDEKQYDSAFWDKMEGAYLDGELTTEGTPPKVSQEQYKNLISAYESGDKRADKYFAEPSDATSLFPDGKNMDQVLADWFKSANGSTTNGKMGGYEAMIPKEMRDAVTNNIGKLIQSPDGKTYVILGLENYDSKGRTNVGAIKVYNTETRKTEYISPYVNDNPNINSITSDIVYRGITDNYTDAKKISDYAVANNVTPENAKEALGL